VRRARLLQRKYAVIAAESRTVRQFWRTLRSPFVRSALGESTIDFYGRLVSPGLTARRVFARVTAVRDEAREVKSLVLEPNGHFRGFRAGQHVNISVEIGGVRHARSYSPSNAPEGDRRVVLTVKRHPRGLVSRFLHDHVHVGDWIELGEPFGELTCPPDAEKVLLIAGGSGITPIASLARSLVARGGHDVRLLAYGCTYSDLIFEKEFRKMALTHRDIRVRFAVTREPPLHGDLGGHFGSDHLAEVAQDASARRTFVCGPPSLVDSVRALWTDRQFPMAPKTETFAPPQLLGAGEDDRRTSVEVMAVLAGRRFAATSGASLLAQAERAGLRPPSGCRRGLCLTCACRKRSGTVRDLATGAVSSEPDERIRICVSEPLSDVTLDL